MNKTCCTLTDRQPPSLGDETLAALAFALAHPARVAIVRMLLDRESCVCGEIVSSLPLAQSTVSQHLKILKDAGWIQGEVDGPRVCYCLNPGAMLHFKTLIGSLSGDQPRAGRASKCAPPISSSLTKPQAHGRRRSKT